jgi:hypothetical protein
MSNKWSEEDRNVLRSEWAAGTPKTAIAMKVGRSLHAIDDQRDYLALPKRPQARQKYTPDAVSRIVGLLNEGQSRREIAAVFGVSHKQIGEVIRRYIPTETMATIIEPERVVDVRADAGGEPLPAFHPISWDAIRDYARASLAREIAEAVAEAATAPPFKPGPMGWGA